MDTIDVVIVGAGIIGCSTAFELSELGLKVEVVEKYKPGAMGSGWTLAGVRQSGRHETEIPLAKYSVKEWFTLSDKLDGKTHYKQEGNLRLARNEDEDKKIIRNMKRGNKLTVTGVSSRGNKTIDVYSLSGFTKAKQMLDKICS